MSILTESTIKQITSLAGNDVRSLYLLLVILFYIMTKHYYI
jgi:hypothetical protein